VPKSTLRAGTTAVIDSYLRAPLYAKAFPTWFQPDDRRAACVIRSINYSGRVGRYRDSVACLPVLLFHRFFLGPRRKMPVRHPVQPGFTNPNAAEAELALIQAMRSQLLARVQDVSQSIRTRVTAVLKQYPERDSRLQRKSE
jgi:hypothetical protein